MAAGLSRHLLLSLSLGVAACDAGTTPGPANDPATEANAPAASVGGPAPNPSGNASAPAPAALALEGEGVRLFDARTGAATPVPFGTATTTALTALSAAFGDAPVEQSTNAECGAGPIVHARWQNGFTGLFQNGQFLGWSVREAGLATASGIGIGSTRAELEANYDAQVEESTLGTEFSAGGLGGILSSAAPDARIEAFWAGLTCLFR